MNINPPQVLGATQQEAEADGDGDGDGATIREQNSGKQQLRYLRKGWLAGWVRPHLPLLPCRLLRIRDMVEGRSHAHCNQFLLLVFGTTRASTYPLQAEAKLASHLPKNEWGVEKKGT